MGSGLRATHFLSLLKNGLQERAAALAAVM
jgi:hypothetical protein